ncbi:LOW QUALITY PROTEIN: Cytochrome P450 2D14, partial [Galemys pyrenaicus]
TPTLGSGQRPRRLQRAWQVSRWRQGLCPGPGARLETAPLVPEQPRQTRAMGLLTGDSLGFLAVAVAVFLLLVDLMHRRARWTRRYPPGPTPLPGLGNLLQLDFHDMANSMSRLQRRYGNVFSLQLGWTPVVVLNGFAAVREALVDRGEDSSDRPPVHITWASDRAPKASRGDSRCRDLQWRPVVDRPRGASVAVNEGAAGEEGSGLVQAPYGHAWREQRRFSVSTLRDFGLGKKSLEQWVTEEAGCLCAAIDDQAGRPFSPISLLNKAVGNVIASLIFARRFEYDDASFMKIVNMMETALKDENIFLQQVLNSMPVLLRIPGLAAKILEGPKIFMKTLDELIAEHNLSRDTDQPPRDLTDAFVDQVEKAKGNPESSFNEENLRLVVSDLFFAGIVTTSTTLAWALLLMILHPEVQRRVQEEIDEVIGPGRRPEMADQARMPFTMAVVHEVQRFADIVPLGVPHMTSRDIEVQGFLIPKGTTLFPNLSSVLKDETIWEKPRRFHPEHFLDAQGRFVRQEAFMPFSAGRRSCLGEPLARMELFLFFTCLLQRFSFSVPAGQPPPSDRGVFAVLVTPAPYQLLGFLAVAVAVFLLLVDLMHRRARWTHRYPPGPTPLPGLGNLLQLDFNNTPYSMSRPWVGRGLGLGREGPEGRQVQRPLGEGPGEGSASAIFQEACVGWTPSMLQRRYGNVFSLQLGWTPVVVLNGFAAVREALVDRGEDSSDRPPSPTYEHIGFGPRAQGKQTRGHAPPRPGLILARYGHAWREQRRFSVSTLRDFGLGKKSLEQWVTEEAGCLCAAIDDQAGRPFSPKSLLDKAVTNVIASLIFARRFEYDDSRLAKLLGQMEKALQEDSGFLREVREAEPVLGGATPEENPLSQRGFLPSKGQGPACRSQPRIQSLGLCSWQLRARGEGQEGKEGDRLGDPGGSGPQGAAGALGTGSEPPSAAPQLLAAIPVLLRIPGIAHKVFPGQKDFMNTVDELISENRQSRDTDQLPRDLTDAFLDQVEKVRLRCGPRSTPFCTIQAKGNPESSFNEENLRIVVSDLFGAGMVTTSTTLAWALLLMILHPEVQRRVQEEIDEVIGPGRRPEMADQARMPFTMAVVHEVQRFADIVPLGVPHMTSRDIEVQGFLIPKGTTLFPNLSSVLKDETIWEKPRRFHPEHFLDAQGRFVRQEAFMPFSAGRRSCLGEPLARMELFLFFTCLLQRFSFSVPAGQPPPSDRGVFAVLVTPAPYQ